MTFSQEKKGYNKAEVDTHLAKTDLATRKVQDEQLGRIRSLRKELDETAEKLTEYMKREKMISDALIMAVTKSEEIEKQARKKYEAELEALNAFHVKWQTYYKKMVEKYPVDETIERAGDFSATMGKILTKLEATQPVPTVRPSAPTVISDIIPQFQNEQHVYGAKSSPAAAHARGKSALSPEESQYEEEMERIGSARGINLAAVSSMLEDAGMEDTRYDRIAASWSKQLVPQEMSDYLDFPVDARTGVNVAALKGSGTNGFSFDEALHPTQELGDIMSDLGFDFEIENKPKKKRRL